MAHVRTKITQLTQDITMHYSKVDLQLKRLAWMTNKKDLEESVVYWFESNGFIPHSCNPSNVPPPWPWPT
jgi:hypothetical protein